MFVIIFVGNNFGCECLPLILKEKGGLIKMKKRIFIIKVLRYITTILLLLTLLVIEIKKMTLNLHRLNVEQN